MSYLRSIPLGPSPLWDMVLALFLDAGNRNLHTFFTTFHWQPPQLCPSVSTAQGHLLWGPSQVIQAQPPSAAPMLPMGTFMQPSLAHRCKCSWSQGCLLSNTWHEKAPKKPPSTRIPRVESGYNQPLPNVHSHQILSRTISIYPQVTTLWSLWVPVIQKTSLIAVRCGSLLLWKAASRFHQGVLLLSFFHVHLLSWTKERNSIVHSTPKNSLQRKFTFSEISSLSPRAVEVITASQYGYVLTSCEKVCVLFLFGIHGHF